MQVRTNEEYARARRQVAHCPTDALRKVATNPLQATSPQQRALNAEFQEMIREELVLRDAEEARLNEKYAAPNAEQHFKIREE